jgi:hypothetical protein
MSLKLLLYVVKEKPANWIAGEDDHLPAKVLVKLGKWLVCKDGDQWLAA